MVEKQGGGDLLNRKGFTLLELVIVVIVLGVLASVALPKYTSFVERAKAAEAVAAIGSIKTAELAYAAANTSGTYLPCTATTDIAANLGVNVSGSGIWNYGVGTTNNTQFIITANRVGGGYAGNTVILTYNVAGTSAWTGNHPGAPKT